MLRSDQIPVVTRGPSDGCLMQPQWPTRGQCLQTRGEDKTLFQPTELCWQIVYL